jgi:abhydrolase domain-containing protein 1/3
MPGLTGNSQNGYVLHFVKQIQNLGYRSVVFNNRGLAGAKLKTPRTFCAANTEDAEFVINHLNKTKPGIPLVAIAVSLGGIILTNYLVKMGKTKPTGLIAAMTVSVPWNTFKSSTSLEEPLNWFIFNRHLTNLLCKLVLQHLAMAKKGGKDRPIDVDHVLQSKTIREFDDRYIAPMFGFADSDDYYTAASLHSKPLEEISIPLLNLSAADDPFAPISSLPLEKIKQCPNVIMALTAFGGHIGFTEGLLPIGAGYADRMMCQYVRAIFENGQSLQDPNCLSNEL